MRLFSPVREREYVWFAEYNDGNMYSEFDFNTKESNSFDNIDRDNLKRFGLIGRGSRFDYDAKNGRFNIGKSLVDMKIKYKNKVLHLTGDSKINYNDCISFKRIAQVMLEDNVSPVIVRYSYGYKVSSNEFNFQPIFHIGENISFEVKLVSNLEDVEGELILLANGMESMKANIKLEKGVKGNFNFKLR